MKRAPGILPSIAWLLRNGYAGLESAMRQNPGAFVHIQQRRWRTKLDEWVAVAARLKKKYGVLPTCNWLTTHGFTGLVSAMRVHPSRFNYAKQKHRRSKTTEEWVTIAERLAEKHGRLPSTIWLVKHHYAGLYHARRKHPNLFAHIKQLPPRRSLTDWVLIAERLAKTHGRLPTKSWLNKHGLTGLATAFSHNHGLFKHIKRAKFTHTKEEWVAIAEKLARKHGRLPNCQWLISHGCTGLYNARRSEPQLFAHIPQKSCKGRRPEEWVPIAEALAARHDGLPSAKWLIESGFRQLLFVRYAHPKLFSHIPQKRLRRKMKRKNRECCKPQMA